MVCQQCHTLISTFDRALSCSVMVVVEMVVVVTAFTWLLAEARTGWQRARVARLSATGRATAVWLTENMVSESSGCKREGGRQRDSFALSHQLSRTVCPQNNRGPCPGSRIPVFQRTAHSPRRGTAGARPEVGQAGASLLVPAWPLHSRLSVRSSSTRDSVALSALSNLAHALLPLRFSSENLATERRARLQKIRNRGWKEKVRFALLTYGARSAYWQRALVKRGYTIPQLGIAQLNKSLRSPAVLVPL